MFAKTRARKGFWGIAFIFLVVILALGGLKISNVFAQGTGPAGSGENSEVSYKPSNNLVIGDDPDEVGYQGSLPSASGEMISSATSSGEQFNLNGAPAVNQTIGDDPDEIGYTGPLPKAASIVQPSGTSSGMFGAYWSLYFQEPQPDSPKH